MVEQHDSTTRTAHWGTFEDLLLACAVYRHGTNRWTSIAMELHNRCSNLTSLSPIHCQHRFDDLKRRFMADNQLQSASFLPMLDELRRIRVEELRRDVERCDVSIVSLELKLRRLEKETDLEKEEKQGKASSSDDDVIAGKSASGEVSDDRESHELNSLSQKGGKETKSGSGRNDSGLEGSSNGKFGNDDDKTKINNNYNNYDYDSNNYNNNNNSIITGKEGNGASGIVELLEPVSGKSKRVESLSCSGLEADSDELSPAVKCEPLARFLDSILSHRLGSTFGHRLQRQETAIYKHMIRQPMDLQTVQRRLDTGSYFHSVEKFFRDLLLIFNNGVMFFSSNSPEHAAAVELRTLVLKEMSDNVGKSQVIDSSVKAVAQVAGSRGGKRELMVDTGSLVKVRKKSLKKNTASKERLQVGQIIMRTSNKGGVNDEYGGNELSSRDHLEIKMDKKKTVLNKKQGAATLLKRTKQNLSGQSATTTESNGDEVVERSERVTRSSRARAKGKVKRGVGRPPKKLVVTSPAYTRGKRRRGNGDADLVAGDAPWQPKKRSRR